MTTPRLVSALEKFLRAPSSDGFIEVLSDYGARKFCCDNGVRADLNAAACQRFKFTHTSFFEFDAALWKLLLTLPLHLNWHLISERRKSSQFSQREDNTNGGNEKGSLPPAIKEELESLVVQSVNSENIRRDLEKNAREKSNQNIIFFAQVNAALNKYSVFSPLVERSKELEELLISFCTTPFSPNEATNSYGDDADWSWISICIAQCYLSSLEAFEPAADSSEDNGIKQTAHLVAMTHLALVYTTALTAIGTLSSSVFALVGKFDSGLENCPAKTFFRLAISQEFDDFTNEFSPSQRLHTFLSLTTAGLVSDPAVLEYFVRCWSRYKYDLDAPHSGSSHDEIFGIVSALQFSLAFSKKPIEERVRYLIGKDATDKQASALESALRNHGFGNFPSIQFATFLSSEIRDFDADGIDNTCGYFAEWLVKRAKRHLRKHKTPLRLSFVSNISEAGDQGHSQRFILKRSTYYKSLSTLAINLAEFEVRSEHFDKKAGFLCYIDAVRAIAQGGYREYSAVFLCYALIRAAVFCREEVGDIQVKALDECVTTVIGDRWASEYLPLVLPYLMAEKNLPLDFRLWGESFSRKHKRPTAQVLGITRFQQPEIEASPTVHIPEWFFGGCDSTLDALKKISRALECQSPSAPQWAQLMERNSVQLAVGELLRQLEAQLVMFFQQAYEAFYDSAEFRELYSSTTRGAIIHPSGANPSWGWIDFFLGYIAIVRDVGVDVGNLDKLRLLANEALPGLGEVLIAINGRKEIVNALREAREIDNEFTSHNAPIKPRDRTANLRGVVHKKRLTRAQVQWVYNYVTVDFGLLFEILRPMVSDTYSRETEQF